MFGEQTFAQLRTGFTRVDALRINLFISLVLAPLDSSMMGSGATFTAAVARAFSGSRCNSGSFSRAVFCPLSKKLSNVGQLGRVMGVVGEGGGGREGEGREERRNTNAIYFL